jgi:hypothetical protein
VTCPDCRYAQEERAAIHEFEGKLPRWQAEERARLERCPKHRERSMVEITREWAMRKDALNVVD